MVAMSAGKYALLVTGGLVGWLVIAGLLFAFADRLEELGYPRWLIVLPGVAVIVLAVSILGGAERRRDLE